MSSGEAAKQLVRKIAENTKLPYFSITPTFSVCKEHGFIRGEKPTCPVCGKETEVYSRIVGYFRPVRNWNLGKKEEFKFRKTYVENVALEKQFKTAVVVGTNGTQRTETERRINGSGNINRIASYKIFTLPGCEKCEDAKQILAQRGPSGAVYNLSDEQGLKVFREYYRKLKDVIKRNEDGSLPVPTVLFLDENERVIETAYSPEEIDKLLAM